jgi:hypothetical protein
MTMIPVNTKLNRASAFELRSKTCAMSAFLLPLLYLRLRVEKFPAMVVASGCFAPALVAGGWGVHVGLPVNFFSNKLRV